MKKQFFKYAIPSILAMWVFSVYTMVDGFFVSYGVGPMALASVNVSMPYINVIFGISILSSIGASAVISILRGKGDARNAQSAFMTNLLTLGGFSISLTLICLLNIETLAKLLGATPILLDGVVEYLSIIVGFSFFFIISYYLEVIARADGFPKLATVAVLLAAAANIGLDYLFVIVFKWGLAGAAWATGIAQVFSTILLFAHFMSKRTNMKIGKFKYDLAYMTKGLKLGFADSITEFSIGASIFLFNWRILGVIGEEGVAAYTVISYVTTLVVTTMCGISQGMQPLVSYSYGRGDNADCSALLKLATNSALVCSLIWFTAVQLFATNFVSIFINPRTEPLIHEMAVAAFKLYSISYLFVGVNVVLATFFSAVEMPKLGTIVSLGRGVFVIGACLYTVSSLFGQTGIWLSPTFSEVICMVVALGLLLKPWAPPKPAGEPVPRTPGL